MPDDRSPLSRLRLGSSGPGRPGSPPRPPGRSCSISPAGRTLGFLNGATEDDAGARPSEARDRRVTKPEPSISSWPPLSRPPLEVYLLGTVDFDEVQTLQRRLVYDLGEKPGAALILCEHPSVISVGRSGSRAHIRADDDELKARGLLVRWVNRGGGCVLHVPGQLVGYVLLSLPAFGLDLKRYVEGLHRLLIRVLDEFDLAGTTRPDHPGVFLGPGVARVATVGVAVGRWVASHGFSLNVGPYLDPFRVLEEPGGVGLRATSMEAWRQRPAPMAKVRESVIRHMELVFGVERHHVYTSHPLIRRKPSVHVFATSQS
jgi:lipoyl(octanoyl) transferase